MLLLAVTHAYAFGRSKGKLSIGVIAKKYAFFYFLISKHAMYVDRLTFVLGRNKEIGSKHRVVLPH